MTFTFANPTGGPIPLTAVVHGYETDGPDSNFTLFTWGVRITPAGNMLVAAPATATQGATGQVGLTFSGLAADTHYLGTVIYTGVPAATRSDHRQRQHALTSNAFDVETQAPGEIPRGVFFWFQADWSASGSVARSRGHRIKWPLAAAW